MGSLEPGRIGVSFLAVALLAIPCVFRYFVLSHNPLFRLAGWDRNLYHHHLTLRLLRISLFSIFPFVLFFNICPDDSFPENDSEVFVF